MASNKRIALGLFVLITVITVVLLSRSITNPSLGYPDADRILMDGVFIHDFLSDLPAPSQIYDYTINYYGQYPALSIGYRPPFFPFVEAVFNHAFGVNIWSSRLAIILFSVIGLAAWFSLVRRTHNNQVAFVSCVLLVTAPFYAKWGWYTMAEIPVLSMAMLTIFLFYRYVESDQAKYIYLTALSFGLAIWTKQTAVFLGIFFILYLLWNKKLFVTLKKKDAWIGVVIILFFATPLAIITLWLGDQNLMQSVGSNVNTSQIDRLSFKNLTILFDRLYNYHFSLPVLIFSSFGLALSIWHRTKREIVYYSVIISVYLLFTYIVGKNERYAIFWMPAFTVFAALPIYYIQTKTIKAAVLAALVAVAVFQGFQTYSKPPNQASGYDQAAEYVLEKSESPIVFFDGYNNGYFTYFMRSKDPNRSMYVLRGDKLLASSSISAEHWLEVHVKSRDEIQSLFDDYGIQYIVVESNNVSGVEIYDTLREMLQTDSFKLVNSIPVVAKNRPPLDGQTLLIYTYLNYKKRSKDTMKLRLPIVGKTIDVKIRRLK